MTADVALLPDRMLEQVETWTAWDRRAWEPGTILRLRELSEASAWVKAGVLSDGALGWLRSSLQPLMGQDPGIGTRAIQSQLSTLLKDKLTLGSQAQRRLNQLIDFADEVYLANWRAALSSDSPVHVERASRLITAQLLDAGYHPEWLRARTKATIKAGATGVDLVDEYAHLLAAPSSTFRGIVPLVDVPEIELMQKASNWVTPEEVSAHLRSQPKQGPLPRQVGGLHFVIEARDVRAAAATVAEMMERLVSRTHFLRGNRHLRFDPFWYTTDGTRHSLTEIGPQINVLSLVKTGVLYSASLTDRRSNAVDDALQLASHLMEGPATVAAAGAWAALESLLTTGADNSRDVGRSVAADRAAALVAASWPRAELTRLSHRAEAAAACPPLLRSRLANAGEENVKRSGVLIAWLQQGNALLLPDARDQAGVERMSALAANPKAVLQRVRTYMTCSLRRLYRQRNLVLHGGSGRPIALSAAIRTSGPLVGAALDRVSHAFELAGVEPLDAVARAECALAAVGSSDGWPLHKLSIA